MIHHVKRGKAAIDNRFSSSNLLIFAVIFAALGGILIIKSFATPLVISAVEAELMTLPATSTTTGVTPTKVIQDSASSSGSYVRFLQNGTATSDFTLPSAGDSIQVKARGSYCRGNANVAVSIDGINVYSGLVNSTWTTYSNGATLATGTHKLAVSYTNDYYRYGRCDRNLDVDVVTASSDTATVPAPTSGPTVPTNLTGTADGAGNITLNWGASTSSGGTINYQVSLAGWGIVSTTAATSTNLSGAVNGTTYTYTVKAIDATGLSSPNSNSFSITPTASTTTTPPPTQTCPAGTTGTYPNCVSTTQTCPTGTTGTYPNCAPTAPPPTTGVLLWSDEFNGTSGATVDGNLWTAINYCDNWGSLSCNTSRAQNLATDGAGHLKITALQENYTDPYAKTGTYSTARIVSKKTSLYGTIQASIKIPHGKGLWPAFWGRTNLPNTGDYGEYDIMEILGDNSYVNYCSVHGWSSSNAHLFGLTNSISFPSDLASGYHVYEMDWAPGVITYKIDGSVCHAYHSTDSGVTSWPFDSAGNIMLNLAVGGSWPGSPDASTVFPATMYVDYVRVYQ